MSFAALKLIDPLLRTLETLGYATPTPVQKQSIPAVLAGRDLLAAAQTGTGKTAAFALPLLQRLTMEGAQAAPNHARSLVLVPTRELAEQVYDSFRTYGRALPLRSYVAYGGVPMEPQLAKLRKGLDVLVATPGRLLDLLRQGAVSFGQLQTLVLDEADRMLDLGFARDLDAIFAALPPTRQTLLFSATFPEAIRDMASRLLVDALSVQVSAPNSTARSVRQMVYTTDKKNKPALFLHLLRKHGWGQVLVFAKTRKGVEQLVGQLQADGISTDAIHGDKTQPARLRALERFKTQQVQVLVATDVAARGLDITALPLVVNFDLPSVAEDYVHRIGRTGRAGAEGQAVSLVCADEVELLRAIETTIKQVLPREEEGGFEADHRVPATGAAAPKAAPKTAANPVKAANPPAAPRRAGPRADERTPAPRPTSKNAPAARPGRNAATSAANSVPKGAIVVTGGRGAKSSARAAAKAVARPGKPGGRPPKR